MLTKREVERFSNISRIHAVEIAESEIVLTYLLQLLNERGILENLAFKGGTCLRKMHFGSKGRFSTDLDFTDFSNVDYEDIVLEMMGVFEKPYFGISFKIADDSYYEVQDKQSWGVNPIYTHDWRLPPAI